MKTLGISCGGLLLLIGSLAALCRFWLIMTIGVGFAAGGNDCFFGEARLSLLCGSAGLALLLGATLLYPVLSRRWKLPAEAGGPRANAAA